MDSGRRQHMRYKRHTEDRMYRNAGGWQPHDSTDHHHQGPLPPIPRGHRYRHRPSSPSSVSSSMYTDEETPMVRRNPPSRRSRSRSGSHLSDHNQISISGHPAIMPLNAPPQVMYSNGTLRSTRSVPTLNMATWDGEPCPVHGMGPPMMMAPGPQYSHHVQPQQLVTMRRSGSMFDIRSTSPLYPPAHPIHYYPPPPPSFMIEGKPHNGSIVLAPPPVPPMPTMYSAPPPPPHLLPPMMRPRQLVIPANMEPIQPLPIRDPSKILSCPPSSMQMLPRKPDEESGDRDDDGSMCKGHLVVLWIILGVVTVGVLLGIILGVIMG